MSVVHFKFKSSFDSDKITFDGLTITLGDLKKAIKLKKKFAQSVDFDLQITNAQTKEVYKDDNSQIAKNSSVIVARIPTGGKSLSSANVFAAMKAQPMKPAANQGPPTTSSLTMQQLVQTPNLAAVQAPEEDKIAAMMKQSTQDFDASTYMKPRMPGVAPPPGYICHRCQNPGHFIHNCPVQLNRSKDGFAPEKVKRSTGIPHSFMTPVSGPEVKGAYLTNQGHYAVPTNDMAAYLRGKKEKPPFMKTEEVDEMQTKKDVPPELLCPLCKDVLIDAVVISCCGNSFCDECIRDSLMETDDHICPHCQEQNVSPDSLIANRFLRTAVTSFLNESGYTKVKKKQPGPLSPPESPPPPPPPPEPQEKYTAKLAMKPAQPTSTTALPDSTEMRTRVSQLPTSIATSTASTQQLVPAQLLPGVTLKADQAVAPATQYPAPVQIQGMSASQAPTTEMNPAMALMTTTASNIASPSSLPHNLIPATQHTAMIAQPPNIPNTSVPPATIRSSLLGTVPTAPTSTTPAGPPGTMPTGPMHSGPIPFGPPGTMLSGPPGTMPSGPPGVMPSGPPGVMPSGPPGVMPSGPPGVMSSGPPGVMPSGPPGVMPTGPPGTMPTGPVGIAPPPSLLPTPGHLPPTNVPPPNMSSIPPRANMPPGANMMNRPPGPGSGPLPPPHVVGHGGPMRPNLPPPPGISIGGPGLGPGGSLSRLPPPGIGRPGSPPDPASISKPLSKEEFYRAKAELKNEERVKRSSRKIDPIALFQRELDYKSRQEKQKQLERRSRSRSHTPLEHSPGSRYSKRSRSKTPSRAVSPEHKLSHCRSSRSYSRSPNGRWKRRSSVSISPTRDRHRRSWSRSAGNRRSYSRSPYTRRSSRSISPRLHKRRSSLSPDHYHRHDSRAKDRSVSPYWRQRSLSPLDHGRQRRSRSRSPLHPSYTKSSHYHKYSSKHSSPPQHYQRYRSPSAHRDYYSDRHSPHYRVRSRSPVRREYSPHKQNKYNLGSNDISTEQWTKWATYYIDPASSNFARDHPKDSRSFHESGGRNQISRFERYPARSPENYRSCSPSPSKSSRYMDNKSSSSQHIDNYTKRRDKEEDKTRSYKKSEGEKPSKRRHDKHSKTSKDGEISSKGASKKDKKEKKEKLSKRKKARHSLEGTENATKSVSAPSDAVPEPMTAEMKVKKLKELDAKKPEDILRDKDLSDGSISAFESEDEGTPTQDERHQRTENKIESLSNKQQPSSKYKVDTKEKASRRPEPTYPPTHAVRPLMEELVPPPQLVARVPPQRHSDSSDFKQFKPMNVMRPQSNNSEVASESARKLTKEPGSVEHKQEEPKVERETYPVAENNKGEPVTEEKLAEQKSKEKPPTSAGAEVHVSQSKKEQTTSKVIKQTADSTVTHVADSTVNQSTDSAVCNNADSTVSQSVEVTANELPDLTRSSDKPQNDATRESDESKKELKTDDKDALTQTQGEEDLNKDTVPTKKKEDQQSEEKQSKIKSEEVKAKVTEKKRSNKKTVDKKHSEKAKLKKEASPVSKSRYDGVALSKWEREDDEVPPSRSPVRKQPEKTEDKALPRSVIEKAEKAFAEKVPRGAIVSSTVSVVTKGRAKKRPRVIQDDQELSVSEFSTSSSEEEDSPSPPRHRPVDDHRDRNTRVVVSKHDRYEHRPHHKRDVHETSDSRRHDKGYVEYERYDRRDRGYRDYIDRNKRRDQTPTRRQYVSTHKDKARDREYEKEKERERLRSEREKDKEREKQKALKEKEREMEAAIARKRKEKHKEKMVHKEKRKVRESSSSEREVVHERVKPAKQQVKIRKESLTDDVMLKPKERFDLREKLKLKSEKDRKKIERKVLSNAYDDEQLFEPDYEEESSDDAKVEIKLKMKRKVHEDSDSDSSDEYVSSRRRRRYHSIDYSDDDSSEEETRKARKKKKKHKNKVKKVKKTKKQKKDKRQIVC